MPKISIDGFEPNVKPHVTNKFRGRRVLPGNRPLATAICSEN
jgi:hypothetical protein